MDRPVFQASKGRQLEIFIAQHQHRLPFAMQYQQGFFKPRDKAGEIFEVSAVLFIGIHDQRVVAMLAHLRKHPGFTLA